MSIKREIAELFNKQKKELETFVESKLTEKFTEYFSKFPKVVSVKINAGQIYNDNDYDTIVNSDCETIQINGCSFVEYDGGAESILESTNLNEDEHSQAADAAESIFNEFSDSVLIHIYGKYFGLKITRTEITIEETNINDY